MANFVLNVQNKASVEGWKTRAQDLNNRAKTAVDEAAQALKEFRATAEGGVIDEIVTYGDGVITGMTQVLSGMNEILTAVNNLVSKFTQVIGELIEGVGSTKRKTLG